MDDHRRDAVEGQIQISHVDTSDIQIDGLNGYLLSGVKSISSKAFYA